MENKIKNIGLFFGSFNPVSIGHLYVAQTLLEYKKLNLDEIWFIVSLQNPDKNNNMYASKEDRFHMTLQAINEFGNDKIKTDDIEFELPIPSFTYKTIDVLKKKYDHYFNIIIGDDLYQNLRNWDYFEKLYNIPFLVYPRENNNSLKRSVFTDEEVKVKYYHDFIPIDLNISSTMIRKRCQMGNTINYLVTSGVANFIKSKNLYKK